MNILQKIMDFNEQFVLNEEYQPFITDNYPKKQYVILTCMDTRLVELLPRAMNVRNGDVKIVKTAGAYVTEPYGSVMRSLIVAISMLRTKEVFVVGHHRCGMIGLHSEQVLSALQKQGLNPADIRTDVESQVDLDHWLQGPNSPEEAVLRSIDLIKNHPLLPSAIPIHGLVIDPKTGQLDLVVDGYEGAK